MAGWHCGTGSGSSGARVQGTKVPGQCQPTGSLERWLRARHLLYTQVAGPARTRRLRFGGETNGGAAPFRLGEVAAADLLGQPLGLLRDPHAQLSLDDLTTAFIALNGLGPHPRLNIAAHDETADILTQLVHG